MFPKLVLLCPPPYPLFFLEEYLLRHSLWSDRLAFPHLAHCGNRGSFVVSFWMWVEMWPTRVEGVQGDPVLLVGCPGSSVSDEAFCSGKQPLVLCFRAPDWQHEDHLGNTWAEAPLSCDWQEKCIPEQSDPSMPLSSSRVSCRVFWKAADRSLGTISSSPRFWGPLLLWGGDCWENCNFLGAIVSVAWQPKGGTQGRLATVVYHVVLSSSSFINYRKRFRPWASAATPT